MAALVLDAEHEKDLRRRTAELDMAHKEYDRAKGHFHSRKARSTCSQCNPFRLSRRQQPATDKSELEGATYRRVVYLQYDLDVKSSLRLFNADLSGLIMAEPLENLDDVEDGSIIPASYSRTTLAHIAVRPAKKRKGPAADFEVVSHPSHAVLAFDDDVDFDGQGLVSGLIGLQRFNSVAGVISRRSYANAVRNTSA